VRRFLYVPEKNRKVVAIDRNLSGFFHFSLMESRLTSAGIAGCGTLHIAAVAAGFPFQINERDHQLVGALLAGRAYQPDLGHPFGLPM
jgi:hypothetical protein